jgi:hypothetical protein
MGFLVHEIQELLRTTDSFAAMEYIQRDGTPLEIAARYDSLVRDFYWKAHDLPGLVVVSRAGIMYCLGQLLVVGHSSDTVEKLGHTAKGMAYNVGSFTWPGWEEPGINPTLEHLAYGRDCARLNLRLAIELNRPPKGLSKAHWLIGAHALVTRDFELAEKEFQLAQDVLPASDPAAKEMEPCNMGYLAVARLCWNQSDAAARSCFEQITARLTAQNDEESQDYLSQLLRARRLFVATSRYH